MSTQLRVSNKSHPAPLATRIHNGILRGEKIELACMGVAPISNAVKAIAAANGMVAPQGKLYTLLPTFGTVDINGETKKLLLLKVIVTELGS